MLANRLIRTKCFRRIELQLLMRLTARALGTKPRRLWSLSADQALLAYAEFTRDHLRQGADDRMLRRMNDEAYRMGCFLRRFFRPKSQSDTERLIAALYQNIGIDVKAHIPGQICFRSCLFSQYYTPAICLAASALDNGIIRGLSGCGHLTFRQRITEGHPCCLATTGGSKPYTTNTVPNSIESTSPQS